jgi:hypothetical protein
MNILLLSTHPRNGFFLSIQGTQVEENTTCHQPTESNVSSELAPTGTTSAPIIMTNCVHPKIVSTL